jgi:hypothetical protein
MWIFDKVKAFFNMLVRAFKSFIDAALPVVTQALLAELKDFAISIVKDLDAKDMTSKAKREEAFRLIKEEAIKRGKSVSDSLVNLLLEIALQFIRNK